MNANRIIDMIVRRVMRRLVNHGVDKGIDMASKVGRKPGQSDTGSGPEADRQMRDTTKRQNQSAKQMRQVSRQMRRFMKFRNSAHSFEMLGQFQALTLIVRSNPSTI